MASIWVKNKTTGALFEMDEKYVEEIIDRDKKTEKILEITKAPKIKASGEE